MPGFGGVPVHPNPPKDVNTIPCEDALSPKFPDPGKDKGKDDDRRNEGGRPGGPDYGLGNGNGGDGTWDPTEDFEGIGGGGSDDGGGIDGAIDFDNTPPFAGIGTALPEKLGRFGGSYTPFLGINDPRVILVPSGNGAALIALSLPSSQFFSSSSCSSSP